MTNKIYKLHVIISSDEGVISEKEYFFFDKSKVWARKKQIQDAAGWLGICLGNVRITDSEITVEE